MHNFTFTTRETYLEYKQNWKERYAAATREIRAGALAVKAAQQALGSYAHLYSLDWREYERISKENRDALHKAEKGMRVVRLNHAKLKDVAGTLLRERQASKVEAGRQWSAKNNCVHPGGSDI
jgi:hypothetical protein